MKVLINLSISAQKPAGIFIGIGYESAWGVVCITFTVHVRGRQNSLYSHESQFFSAVLIFLISSIDLTGKDYS